MGNCAAARQLLEQVVKIYASIDSYSDKGSVTQQVHPGDPVLRTEFSTLYKRPNLFRFEFSRPHPYPPLRHLVTRHVVGYDGFGAYSLQQGHEGEPTLQTRDDLSHAVAGAAGVSSGSAHNIGRLLLHEVAGLSLLDLIDPRFGAEVEIAGAPCYTVSAELPMGGERELCIERGALLVRRVRTHQGNAPATEELREAIRVNPPLDDACFIIESPDHWAPEDNQTRLSQIPPPAAG
jgi:hypothetical protein